MGVGGGRGGSSRGPQNCCWETARQTRMIITHSYKKRKKKKQELEQQKQ